MKSDFCHVTGGAPKSRGADDSKQAWLGPARQEIAAAACAAARATNRRDDLQTDRRRRDRERQLLLLHKPMGVYSY